MKGFNTYRIIGIDPSVDNMGFSVIDLNIATMQAVVMHAETFSGKRLAKRFPHIEQIHGEKVAKLMAHQANFAKMFERWEPNAVAIEAPFLGRFPAAFASLTQCLSIVRQALIGYNYNLELREIDPPTVKKTVGVSGGSSDKEAIRRAIGDLPSLHYPEAFDLDLLDEHSCDAIAVAYWLFRDSFWIESALS